MRILDEALDLFSRRVVMQQVQELAIFLASRHTGIAEPQEHGFDVL